MRTGEEGTQVTPCEGSLGPDGGSLTLPLSRLLGVDEGGGGRGRPRHPPAHYLPPAIEMITPERLLLGSERI